MGTSPFQAPVAPVRVLVIEPSATTRELFREALFDQGLDLMFSEDGFAALSKIDEWCPNMIFAATQMPRLDGYRLAHIIKINKRHGNTPVVLVSHDPDLFERARGRLVGARGHLVTPLNVEVVQETVARFYEEF